MNMKKLLIGAVCLLMALTATSQTDSTKVKTKKERKVELYGEVYDSFTKARIKAFMTLMRPDSTVVDTMTCWSWGTNSLYEFKVPAKQADFIIKGTAEGYEDTYMNYQLRHMARNSSFKLPRMLMKKKQEDDIWKESSLDGVVVTGTKVKIAYRGDTIVYNASAFNLPEGSMLDGLIRQMPGAELKDNGDIYINGKKIDYLTLNGKDFFKGQNKVMLDNLPYFTVKDIKVYNKSTKQSEMIGHDMEKKDYVMDVALKREYNRGYLANAEVGGGTDDRYMARLFGLYYDDHSRFSLFGNVNNVNETRRPGGEGEWQPSNMPQGLRATKQVGVSFNTEDADKNWEEEIDAALQWDDADHWSRTSNETFASDGNIFGGSESRSRQKDFRFNASNNFRVMKPFQANSYVSVNYYNGRRNTFSQDSTYRDFLINETHNDGLNKYRSFNLNASLYSYKKFDWGDYVIVGVTGSYNSQKPSDSFSRSNTRYAQTAQQPDFREYYVDTHGDSYNYSVSGNYIFQLLNRWYIGPTLSYSQTMNNTHNSNYRLDWLGNMTTDNHDLGWLPSTREALEGVLDAGNSDSHIHLNRVYNAGLELNHNTDDMYFGADISMSHHRERMHFVDDVYDTIAHRSYTDFTPQIHYYRWGNKNGLSRASYSMQISRPDFASLMPADDTTNPLALRINNPDLKATVNHNFNLGFTFGNDSLKRHLELWTSARITRNSWGTRTTYNSQTGAYTYKNDNINGNWYWGMGNSYQQPLDKAKRLTLQHRNDVEYTHSVDFDILYVAQSSQPTTHPTSTVNNWTVHENLSLEYQHDKLTVSVSGDFSWRNSTSNRQNFQRINAYDYNYGGRLLYTIPWVKLSVATDLRMYSRRGYQSAMMNTDDLVWNAELSRSLLKEKLTVKLTAFDLLHQLSSTRYNVNAQGRTETWQNCIPRYVMLSLAYKFTQRPKR